MEEVSEGTTFMKKIVIGVVSLVIVLGVAFVIFDNPKDGECVTETEVVSPLDVDTESSPF